MLMLMIKKVKLSFIVFLALCKNEAIGDKYAKYCDVRGNLVQAEKPCFCYERTTGKTIYLLKVN